jgi:imidazolonepropionase-like amidohydrolase
VGYLITNVRILDATGREPYLGAVRVEGHRIAEVVVGAPAPAADGATVIDGAGATLMPGLVESHAHLGLADMASHDLNRLPIEEQMLVTIRNARTMLDCGYTSAFSATPSGGSAASSPARAWICSSSTSPAISAPPATRRSGRR